MKISAEGGDCEIEYTLENSVAGGRIEASHEGDWISDLNYDVLGTVTFTVAANETRDAREGSLTVEYIIPDAEPLSFIVAVVQQGADADVVFKAAFFEGDYYGTYKFDFFCFDDSPDYNLFTATWSGELELEGYYEGSAASRPVSKLNRLK